jgi:hypothetical protein
LDDNQYKLINLIINIGTAVGTVGAVIVALWLAFRERRIFLNINAFYSVQFSTINSKKNKEVISIQVTNCGSRSVLITSLGWKIGYFKKRYIIQIHDYTDPLCSKLPSTLNDGEIAYYFIPKRIFFENIQTLFPNYWKKFPWFSVKSLKVWVGSPLCRKPILGEVDSDLIKLIFDELKKKKLEILNYNSINHEQEVQK